MRVAAIDIGTITARLLIADVSGGADWLSGSFWHIETKELFRRNDIVNLGEDMSRGKSEFSEATIERVVDVLIEYAEAIVAHKVDRIVAVTTAAAREAANADEFIDLVHELGIPLEIISGEEEADLSFLGTTVGMKGRILVADIGGGSTELIVGHAGEKPDTAVSYPVGSRRVTNLFLRNDPPKRAQIEATVGAIRETFKPFFEENPGPYDSVVAVAGAATTLSAIYQGLDPYDPEKVHLSTLTPEHVKRLRDRLGSMNTEDRRKIKGLEEDRAPVIVGGALIVEEVLQCSGQDRLTISEYDLLYGLLMRAYNQ